MTTATLSPKFQLSLPKKVREAMNLFAGMKFEVVPYGDRIELIPIHPIHTLKGIVKGMDTTIIREKDRI